MQVIHKKMSEFFYLYNKNLRFSICTIYEQVRSNAARKKLARCLMNLFINKKLHSQK